MDHGVRSRCYNVTKRGVVYRIFGKSPLSLLLSGMSSKQLLRIKEVPVEVSTKLKQHDIITCKVISVIDVAEFP